MMDSRQGIVSPGNYTVISSASAAPDSPARFIAFLDAGDADENRRQKAIGLEIRNGLVAGNGGQRPPHADEIDTIGHEANGAVAHDDVDAAGMMAARGGGVVRAGIAADAREIQERLAVTPALIEDVRAGAV